MNIHEYSLYIRYHNIFFSSVCTWISSDILWIVNGNWRLYAISTPETSLMSNLHAVACLTPIILQNMIEQLVLQMMAAVHFCSSLMCLRYLAHVISHQGTTSWEDSSHICFLVLMIFNDAFFPIHIDCRCNRCLCTCAEHPTAVLLWSPVSGN